MRDKELRKFIGSRIKSRRLELNLGQQYIAANITNGTGTMTIGSRTMKATVTNTKRDNYYMMTAYSVELVTPDEKYLDVVITKRDKGTYSVLVYFADGKMRYDFSTSY